MFKPVRNIDTHDFDLPFDFYTYELPKGKIVSVPDDLFAFLQERFPMSFDFAIDTTKPVPQVKRSKTPAVIPSEERRRNNTVDMQILSPKPPATFGGADITPPSGTTDKDGVSWYGEGIQIEGGTSD